MHKFKRMFTLLLVLSLVLTLGATASANSPDFDTIYAQTRAEEMRRLQEIASGVSGDIDYDDNLLSFLSTAAVAADPDTASPLFHGNCTNCAGFTEYVCMQNPAKVDEGYHGSCYVQYFQSDSYRVCRSCLTTYEYMGKHDCWEVHDTCAKGFYDVCPVEVS